MRRIVIRVVLGVGMAAIVGLGFGLARARPDLLASAMARLRGAAEEGSSTRVLAGEPTTAPSAETVDDGWCDRPEAGSLPCRRRLPLVRLAAAGTAARIGLETAEVSRRRHAHQLAGNAEITYAAHAYAHVTSRVAGRVSGVIRDEGEKVRKGDVLVVVDSAEVGSAKATYLGLLPVVDSARKNYDRLATLAETKAASQKDVLDARSALDKLRADLLNARQRLLNLGFTEADLARIARTEDTSNRLEIVAPMDGTLVERHAIVGEAVVPASSLAVGPANSLFDVADLDHLWCWIDVSEAEVGRVAVGQDVTFTISETDAPVFEGHVELIGFAVNPATRTVRVRAELHNADGRLRDGQFGRALIRVGREHQAAVIPRSALQNDGQADLVFLPEPNGRTFRPQRVLARPLEPADDLAEIAWGLAPGQRVVTTGSFLLKSEMFKERIAGED
jgi:membrane fusion protein, heavy metal efflux system